MEKQQRHNLVISHHNRIPHQCRLSLPSVVGDETDYLIFVRSIDIWSTYFNKLWIVFINEFRHTYAVGIFKCKTIQVVLAQSFQPRICKVHVRNCYLVIRNCRHRIFSMRLWRNVYQRSRTQFCGHKVLFIYNLRIQNTVYSECPLVILLVTESFYVPLSVFFRRNNAPNNTFGKFSVSFPIVDKHLFILCAGLC